MVFHKVATRFCQKAKSVPVHLSAVHKKARPRGRTIVQKGAKKKLTGRGLGEKEQKERPERQTSLRHVGAQLFRRENLKEEGGRGKEQKERQGRQTRPSRTPDFL